MFFQKTYFSEKNEIIYKLNKIITYRTFSFFGKCFSEKSRPKDDFLFFSENTFPKNLALKTAFYFFRKMLFRKISP